MRFLVDVKLPPALAQWLADHGCAATTVRDAGLRESDDGSIRNFAVAGDWMLITKDEDSGVRTDEPLTSVRLSLFILQYSLRDVIRLRDHIV